jgi:hypothetical protein
MPSTFGRSSHRIAIFTSALAAAALATAGLAQAQDVAPYSVNGKRPTTLTVRIVGLSSDQIRREVHKTAFDVCRNAASNGEVEVMDTTWCAHAAASRTLSRYRAALHASPGAGELRTAALVIQPAAGEP